MLILQEGRSRWRWSTWRLALLDVAVNCKNKAIEEVVLGNGEGGALGLHYLHKTRSSTGTDRQYPVNKLGIVKLADFGMSGQMENSLDVKVSVGTATYMAPRGYARPIFYSSRYLEPGHIAAGTGGWEVPVSSTGADGSVKQIAGFWDLLDITSTTQYPLPMA